jgi:hypothetical protein
MSAIPPSVSGPSPITPRSHGLEDRRHQKIADRPPAGTDPSIGTREPVQEGRSESGSDVRTDPPAGVDASLWSLLTSEERAHFAQAQELGPLTYGRQKASENPGGFARGGRIDVRV